MNPGLGPQPNLRTSRLWLSPFVAADAAAVFAYGSDPEVSRHTTWTTHRSLEDAEQFIGMVQSYQSQFCWAIRRSEAGPAEGAIEFALPEPATGSVHYVLARPLWNQGLMTEAVAAVVNWAFAAFPAMGLIRTAATADNTGSRRVLEKCGFEFAELVQERWEKFPDPVSLAVYALTRRRWEGGTGR